MRLQPVDSLMLPRPSLIEYFLFGVRLVHGLTSVLPGILILAFWKPHTPETPDSYVMMLVLFGVVCVLMFQALGVYSETIFSNRSRFKMILFVWSSAFCVLLFMHKTMGLLHYITQEQLMIWFAASLLMFCVERVLLLLIFKRLMARGFFLQKAVILGATENGQRLAEYMLQNQDIRSGVLGFIDDRIGRMPKTMADLPLLGNTRDLETLIREERVTQVLVALPWSAENRMDHIIRELRRFPVNVLLVPDMVAFRHPHNRITEV